LVIWGFSIAVALLDVKDELVEKIRKQVGRARLRPVDPLAGQSVAETLAPTAMDEKERWVFHLVSEVAIALRLNVRILVLQDSMGHYLVHFAQGKRLTSYRVDKAWVADSMAGKAEVRERTYAAIDHYLRQEFLGQKIPPKAAPAAAPKPAAAAAPAASASTKPAVAPDGAAPKPVPTAPPAPAPAASAPADEMSREEKIAAAKAKAEAIKAQRAAGGPAPGSGEKTPPAQDASGPASGSAAPAAPQPGTQEAPGSAPGAAPSSGAGEISREEKIAAAKAKAEAIKAQRAAGDPPSGSGSASGSSSESP
jgi:hypothetical protein